MLAKNIIYKIRKKYDIHSMFKNTRRYFSNNNNEGSMLHGLSEGTIYGRKNGEIVDKKKLSRIILKNNDRIEVVHFIGGG